MPKRFSPGRTLLLSSIVAGLMSLSACGGDDVGGPDDREFGELDLSFTSSDYNGYFSDLDGDLEIDTGNEDTTLTVRSGFRRFRIVLADDVLKKGQVFDLNDSDEARATYDEGDDKVWVAVDGRAEVTEELLGTFNVRLTDLELEPVDDEENQALGTFDLDGRLVRR